MLLGWLLGVQYARAPVILLVVGNLLNIVLDLWLVMGLRMNVRGSGAGHGHRGVRHPHYWPADGEAGADAARRVAGDAEKRPRRGDLRRLLALNRDIMLRSLLLQLCFGALTVFGARLGSDIVAVNAVLMTMLTFTAYALDGFAYAVEAHSGRGLRRARR